MKYCPKCKNKGWKPTEGFNKPLVHKGKINHTSMSVRYYFCVNCGSKIKTIEKFFEFVEEQDLFSSSEEETDNG